jgi:hypothetical protein
VGGYAEWLTLAADDLVYGQVLKSKGYTFFLVDNPYVYWGRHIESKGYAKEAYRYGLGDGEAKVNKRQFIKSIVEALFRISFLVLAVYILISSFNHSTPAIYILGIAALLFGFKPYLNSLKNWLRLKSSKYNQTVLLYSFYLIERTRFNYIKGYINGYFFSSPEQKKQAKNLGRTLNR